MLPRLFVAALLVSCAPAPECPELPAEIDFREGEHFHTAGAELPPGTTAPPATGTPTDPGTPGTPTAKVYRIFTPFVVPINAPFGPQTVQP